MSLAERPSQLDHSKIARQHESSGFESPSHQNHPKQRLGPHRNSSHDKKHYPKRPHMRSQSHTKVPTRLSTSGPKPHLNRSKSSDVIRTHGNAGLKRNNRSWTKLTGLQPLTKTLLNNSLKGNIVLNPVKRTQLQNSLKSLSSLKNASSSDLALTKTQLRNSIRSSKSSNSLKGLNAVGSVNNGPSIGLRSSSKRGKAILRLNGDADNNEYEDMSESSVLDDETASSRNDSNEAAMTKRISNDLTAQPEPVDKKPLAVSPIAEKISTSSGSDGGPQREKNNKNEVVQENANVRENSNTGTSSLPSRDDTKSTSPAFVSTNTSTDDLNSSNLYGGSLLLSQSTGLTRNINDPVGYQDQNQQQDASLHQMLRDEPATPLYFGKNQEADESSQQQSLARQTGSYQPNQSIFSNLQRNNSKFLSNMKLQRQPSQQLQQQQQLNTQPYPAQQSLQAHQDRNKPGNTTQISSGKALYDVPNGGKDFSDFLNSSHSGTSQHANNIETRTQQRLWLQRENSMMDGSQLLDSSKLNNFSNLSLNKLMFAHNYNTSSTNMRDLPGSVGSMGPYPSNTTPVSENVPPASSQQDPLSVPSLMFLVQSNQHQNSVQSRTEYERLNREYLNVRRHLNPVAESCNRLEQYEILNKEIDLQKKLKKKSATTSSMHTQSTNANNFEHFTANKKEYEEQSSFLVNKLWQDALLLAASSSSPSKSSQNEQSSADIQQQQQQQHGSRQQRGPNSVQGTPNRLSMPPTTRAVKLAAQAASSNGAPSLRQG